jgi:hypothetical protein
MKKIFFLVGFFLVLTFLVFYKLFPETITGLLIGGNATVGIKEVLDGEITALILKEVIEFEDIQKISVEFSNTGSKKLTEKMEVRIYFNNETGKLYEKAYYHDSARLNPGMRRVFKISFLPQKIGLYYVKARVEYDSKVKEKWESFLVTYIPPPPPVQVIGVPPRAYALPPVIKEIGRPRMSVEYPRSIKMIRGEKKLFNISVKNTGEVSLKNLRFYISTTNLIKFDMNPKQVFKLLKNESVLFLLWIEVPETTPEGKYPFEFEVVSDRVKESGSIELEVVSLPPSLKEEVYEAILNYEYMILEVQNEIDSAISRGVDVGMPLNSLNKARMSLERAKRLYEQEKYEDAKEELIQTKEYLMDTVYQLASASVTVYLPAVFPWWIVFIIIVIGIGFLLFLILMKKKEKEKEKRPKLLRRLSETET